MERFEAKTIQSIIYEDPELRKQMHTAWQEQQARLEANRLAAEAFERSRPERSKAFWQSLGLSEMFESREEDKREAKRRRLRAMPAAEAWIEQHPFEMNLETCPTIAALEVITRSERRRLKATRRILKELGIK